MSHPRPTVLETSAGKPLSEELPVIVREGTQCTDVQRTPLVKHSVPLAPEAYYGRGFADSTSGQRIQPEIFSFKYNMEVGGTMNMMKYMFRQTTRSNCGYACTEMVKHDFNPGREIDWGRVFHRSRGEFGEESRLFPSSEWCEVKYHDSRFPRVCNMHGHFVVVDYVDVGDTVYFRDPYTAQVMYVRLEPMDMNLLRGHIYCQTSGPFTDAPPPEEFKKNSPS